MLFPSLSALSATAAPDEHAGSADHFARLAARALHVPVAIVTLIEHGEQHFIGAYGLDEAYATTRRAPLSSGFCLLAMTSCKPVIVEDAARHPLVESGEIEAAFGIAHLALPLYNPNNEAVGAITVVDASPRTWSADEIALLDDIRAAFERDMRWQARASGRNEAEEVTQVYAAAIQQSSEAILITDAQLAAPGPRILYANPAFCTMTGYSHEELLGQNPRMFQGPEADRVTTQRLRAALEQGEHFTGDTINYRKDGTAYHVEWQVTPVCGPDGQPRYFASTQRDVTERSTAALELQSSEARFRDLAANSPDFIYIIDVLNRKTTYFNRSHFVGYSTAEMEGPGSILASVHPDDTTPVQHYWQEVLRSHPGSVNMVEYRLRNKQDAWEWIESRGATLSSSIEGAPTQIILTLRIITERKMHEEALRESEERYRTVTETATDAILTVDDQSQIVFANCAVEHIFGYTPQELIGQPIQRLMPTNTQQQHEHAFMQYNVTGIRRLESWAAFEVPGQHRAGHTIPLEISMGEVTRAGRRLFTAVIRDISVRRRMEQELQHSYTLLNAIVEGTTDAVFVKNLDGRYISMNTAGATLMNRSVAEVIGTDDNDLFEGETARQIIARDNEIMRSGIAETFEEEDIINGRRVTFLTTKNPFRDADGSITGLIGISRDITERKLLEAQFLQAQKMESIGRLAGGIAHDFNNLLTAILGYTDFLLDSTEQGGTVHTDLGEIQRAAQRATTLTRQLLAFARRQVIEPRSLNINTLLLDMTKLIRRLIGEDIELVVLPSARPEFVRADPGQLEQVIVNLAVNARDAMPHGGKLTICVDCVQVGSSYQPPGEFVPGHSVEIQVIDTGMGMDEPTLNRIFEPFFTTKPTGLGTGLGLATCYGIIHQHGGQIWVESEPGGGTTFHIMLPGLDHHTETEQPELVGGLAGGGNECILLVEDEPSVRALAVRILRRGGYQVLEASNGVDALAVVAQWPGTIDLLLTDLVMPQMGGVALAEELWQRYGPFHTLFMSGYTETAITISRNDVTPHFLQKPFTPQALAQAVRSALDL